MLLKLWARREGLSDVELGERIGISAEHARKLRFRARGASPATAARIFTVTGGQVGPLDLVPLKSRPAPSPAEARP